MITILLASLLSLIFTLFFFLSQRSSRINQVENQQLLMEDNWLMSQFPIMLNDAAGNYTLGCVISEVIVENYKITDNVNAVLSSKCVYLDKELKPQTVLIPIIIEAFQNNQHYTQLLGGYERKNGLGIHENANFTIQAIHTLGNRLGLTNQNEKLYISISNNDLLIHPLESGYIQFTKSIFSLNSAENIHSFARTGDPKTIEIRKYNGYSVIFPTTVITPRKI